MFVTGQKNIFCIFLLLRSMSKNHGHGRDQKWKKTWFPFECKGKKTAACRSYCFEIYWDLLINPRIYFISEFISFQDLLEFSNEPHDLWTSTWKRLAVSGAPERRRRTTSRWCEGFIEEPLHTALKTKWSWSRMLWSFLFLCESSTIVLRTLFRKPEWRMFRWGAVEGQASGSNERYL